MSKSRKKDSVRNRKTDRCKSKSRRKSKSRKKGSVRNTKTGRCKSKPRRKSCKKGSVRNIKTTGPPCLDKSIKEIAGLDPEYKFKSGKYNIKNFKFNILDGDFFGAKCYHLK